MMNLPRAFMTHKIRIDNIVALRYPIEQELPIQVNIFGLKIDTVWYSLLRVLFFI